MKRKERDGIRDDRRGNRRFPFKTRVQKMEPRQLELGFMFFE